jgi:hypothetical protein
MVLCHVCVRAIMHKNKTVKANICSAWVFRPPTLTLSLGEADTFPDNNNITLEPQNLKRNKRIADKGEKQMDTLRCI